MVIASGSLIMSYTLGIMYSSVKSFMSASSDLEGMYANILAIICLNDDCIWSWIFSGIFDIRS